jgi:hypothetical protein
MQQGLKNSFQARRHPLRDKLFVQAPVVPKNKVEDFVTGLLSGTAARHQKRKEAYETNKMEEAA